MTLYLVHPAKPLADMTRTTLRAEREARRFSCEMRGYVIDAPSPEAAGRVLFAYRNLARTIVSDRGGVPVLSDPLA